MSNQHALYLAIAAFLAPLLYLLVTRGDELFVDDLSRGELYYFMSPG